MFLWIDQAFKEMKNEFLTKWTRLFSHAYPLLLVLQNKIWMGQEAKVQYTHSSQLDVDFLRKGTWSVYLIHMSAQLNWAAVVHWAEEGSQRCCVASGSPLPAAPAVSGGQGPHHPQQGHQKGHT